MPEKQWSGMSPHELLDLAQQALQDFEENPRADDRQLYRGYPVAKYRAEMLLAAAQVQATADLTWTLQNRTQIGLPEHHGAEPPR